MVPIGVHSQKLGYVISNHKNEIVENPIGTQRSA